MSLISTDVLPDPIKVFENSQFMRSRTRKRASANGPPFWLDPKVQEWNVSRSSSLVMIKGTRKLRFHMRGFCTDIITSLRNAEVPVFWALHSIDSTPSTTGDAVSSIELIKYLIAQIVRANTTMHIDASLTPLLGSYSGAKSEQEWINLLASVLSGIPLLYLVLDVEILGQSVAESPRNFWAVSFHDIFSQLQRAVSKPS